MQTTPVAVIGRCAVAQCRRPATQHLHIRSGAIELAGAVCNHCARLTEAAAFLATAPKDRRAAV